MIIPTGEIPDRHSRVGCDVVAVEDIQESLEKFGDRYLKKVFTDREISDCRGHNRVQRLAARFAAKEAVIKAFAEPEMAFPLREIEVIRDGDVPRLQLSGTVARAAQRQGWLSTSLSLSHADCHAMAVLVAICGPPAVEAQGSANGQTGDGPMARGHSV